MTHELRLHPFRYSRAGHREVGTSLLYALRAVIQTGLNPLLLSDVLGVLSLIFWAIALVVGLKYVAIVLPADNDGEGGVLALTPLALARAHFNIAGTLSAMASSPPRSRC